MRRCLVTGGAGFIGSHIVDALVADGHETTVLDDLSTGNRDQVNIAARLVVGSVCDVALLEQCFATNQFEVIYHLAAQTDVMTSVDDPDSDAKHNILGGIRVLECCRRHGARKVIYSSSSAVFGEPDYLPMDEAHPVRPICPYAASKHTLEHYLEIARINHGLDYTVLRYANAYGPRQDPHHEGGVVAIFAHKVLNGVRPTIYGDGMQTRDFVHVADLVRANLDCLDRADGQSLNLGTGTEVTITDLFQRIAGMAGTGVEPHYADERQGEMKRLSLDSRKAAQVLDWKPQVELIEGLESVLAHFTEN